MFYLLIKDMAAETYIKKIMFKTAVCQIFPWNLEVRSTWEYVCHKTFKHMSSWVRFLP